jgi:hypothetical protein
MFFSFVLLHQFMRHGLEDIRFVERLLLGIRTQRFILGQFVRSLAGTHQDRVEL